MTYSQPLDSVHVSRLNLLNEKGYYIEKSSDGYYFLTDLDGTVLHRVSAPAEFYSFWQAIDFYTDYVYKHF